MFVSGDHEAVAAGVGRPAGGQVGAGVADRGEEEAQVAFFGGFVSGYEVVCGGSYEGERLAQC